MRKPSWRQLLTCLCGTCLMAVNLVLCGCGAESRPATEDELRKYEEGSRKAVQQEAELQRRFEQGQD